MNPIRHIRKNVFSVTQMDFAKIIGVSQAAISHWENEAYAAEPTLSDIKAIRDAAIARGLPWDDDFLFARPVVAGGAADAGQEGAG